MSGGDAQCEMMVQVCWNASSTYVKRIKERVVADQQNQTKSVMEFVESVAGGKKLLLNATQAIVEVAIAL